MILNQTSIYSWHISIIFKICFKAIKCLKRNGKHLNKLGQLKYYTFVMSNLSYCSLTWHFCGEQYTRKIKIDKIHERAFRIIYEVHQISYEKLLQISYFPSLNLVECAQLSGLKINFLIQDLVVIKKKFMVKAMLNDSCDIFCMKNIKKKATCYTRNSKPTLLDVSLTNQEN